MIETEADVIRVLRENPRILFRALHEDPELLDEVRRLVLTEELLAVPGQITEVLERQNHMEGQLSEIQDQIGDLRGAELERRIMWILPSRLNRMYNLRRPQVVQRRGDHTPHVEGFLNEVEDAEDASTISASQRARIEETDMIIRARRRDGPGMIYIAVEASTTIKWHDISRVNATATALRTAFRCESAAVTVGYEIRSEDEKRAEAAGVEVIVLDSPRRQDVEDSE